MKKHFIWIGLVTLCLLVVTTSCCKKQNLTVSKGILTFNFDGGIDFFQIEADCNWTIEATADWFSVSPSSGSNNATVTVTAQRNNHTAGRNASLTVVSSNGKIKKTIEVVQNQIDISMIVRKFWFTRFYERWNTDYYDEYIPESYRSWTYEFDPGAENWLWFFIEDTISYQIHTFTHIENNEVIFDTVFYPFEYIYYPEGDSIYVNFLTVDETVEDYHATIYQLDHSYFVFSDAYRPHQFEKITTINVTGGGRSEIKVNPKKVRSKPAGPLISVN